jgi:hypothetical protein
MVALIGIAGYRSIASTIPVSFPFLYEAAGIPTSTPRVIRPSPPAVVSTAASPLDSTEPQTQLTTPSIMSLQFR